MKDIDFKNFVITLLDFQDAIISDKDLSNDLNIAIDDLNQIYRKAIEKGYLKKKDMYGYIDRPSVGFYYAPYIPNINKSNQ